MQNGNEPTCSRSFCEGFASAEGYGSTWRPAWLEDFVPDGPQNNPRDNTERDKSKKNRRVKQSPKKVIVVPPHSVVEGNGSNPKNVGNRDDSKNNSEHFSESGHSDKSTKCEENVLHKTKTIFCKKTCTKNDRKN